MYEAISAILLVFLTYITYVQQTRIDTLRDSYTEFLTQYTLYVKAVGDHAEAVQKVLEDLDNKVEKGYYATTALATHTEYLQWQLKELKEFVEYQDKRLIEGERDAL